MKQVSQHDFHKFINNYSNKLDIDDNFMIEPPIRFYHDFSLPNKDTIIAKVHMERDESFSYFIKEQS